MTKVESGAVTRQKLLEAAETLFSEMGFDRVTVRDVTDKAGANVAAVNYHFGSREGLVEKVIERHIGPVNEERLARLDMLERKAGGKAVVLEEILEAFVRPFLTQLRRSELSEKVAFKLMGRMLGDQAGRMPPVVEAQFDEVAHRFRRAFGKALPHLDEDDLWWRTHFMVGGIIHAMVHGDLLHRLSRGAAGNPSTEQTLSRFIRFAAAGLRHGLMPDEVRTAVSDPVEPAESPDARPQGEFLF
jgi:AcrR family transcriptional regulator